MTTLRDRAIMTWFRNGDNLKHIAKMMSEKDIFETSRIFEQEREHRNWLKRHYYDYDSSFRGYYVPSYYCS